MLFVVAPLLHRWVYDPFVLAVSTTESPRQIVGFLLVVIAGTAAIGVLDTVTVKLAETAQLPEPHDAEYIVVAIGVTDMALVVAPVLHSNPDEQLAAVRVTDSPKQIVLFGAVNVGTLWALTVIS
jgi:hypothetical protein